MTRTRHEADYPLSGHSGSPPGGPPAIQHAAGNKAGRPTWQGLQTFRSTPQIGQDGLWPRGSRRARTSGVTPRRELPRPLARPRHLGRHGTGRPPPDPGIGRCRGLPRQSCTRRRTGRWPSLLAGYGPASKKRERRNWPPSSATTAANSSPPKAIAGRPPCTSTVTGPNPPPLQARQPSRPCAPNSASSPAAPDPLADLLPCRLSLNRGHARRDHPLRCTATSLTAGPRHGTRTPPKSLLRPPPAGARRCRAWSKTSRAQASGPPVGVACAHCADRGPCRCWTGRRILFTPFHDSSETASGPVSWCSS